MLPNRFILLLALMASLAGCASNGNSDSWSDVAILPNMTNVPELHYTEDGFDPPFDFY
jgi:type IV pilus biogenesis protein CpaD/CtpE